MSMIMKWSKGDKKEQAARDEKIAQVLPKRGLISSFIQPKLLKAMQVPLIAALKKELEIYRKYPKEGKYKPKEFDPRNNKKCFMGQGFQANSHGVEGWTDFDLKEYRKKVGTIDHREWGDVTLLEIWAGDHFEKYGDMVLNAFMYGWGEAEMPEIKFHINPFYKNPQSGSFQKDDGHRTDETYAKYLTMVAHYCEIRDRMKKAGVKSPMELAWEEKDDPVKRKRRRNEF